MIKFVFLVMVLSPIVCSQDGIVDKDILERYTQLCTRIEWSIKSDHEYYMTGLSRSYSLQSVRNSNDQLYVILGTDPVLEVELLKKGKNVLKEIVKGEVSKKYSFSNNNRMRNVTYFSFSSIN